MLSRRPARFMVIGVFTVMLCTCIPMTVFGEDTTPPPKRRSFARRILIYIPHRLMDILDILSLEVGFGSSLHVNVHVTRAVQLGAGVGWNASLIKDYHRQYGTAFASERELSVPFYTLYRRSVRNTTGTVIPVEYHKADIPSPQDDIYLSGARDFWAVGLEGSVFFFVPLPLGELRIDFHPLEVLDLATGLIGIDLRKDDW